METRELRNIASDTTTAAGTIEARQLKYMASVVQDALRLAACETALVVYITDDENAPLCTLLALLGLLALPSH